MCQTQKTCFGKFSFSKIKYKSNLTLCFLLKVDILSAKNVVIIGDQMQLSSPISAVHPGESGKSLPEFLLKDHDTIRPNKGIFIDKTRRLHPKLCNFTSENFYDGRFKNFDFTEKRKITLHLAQKKKPQ